jgi:hypothetical protein
MPSMGNVSDYSFVVYVHCHYMFWPNRISLGVRVVVKRESAAHYKAALFLLCGYLGLHLVMCVNHLF